ncbi:FAD-dependent oxidoreductase [Robertkochia marina]|uniref:FAD-dependent oxidoreductase n=1 Tax=Robertkochia marina TaxID=1227945 RepID=A0A4S3M0L7_9FLAO|nr:NAD(P)/FAD-dependent oxidoreductase [Robertkochia marina]THD67577.1 FAD-dependent oxidoreductase [Robertkochia marina]TRZ44555.1 FAD-dependent oxidoreductase [Robertkochia marina]
MDLQDTKNSLHADIVIIGAGLTGLTLNYLLRSEGLKVVVVEARDRVGGRIHTLHKKGEPTVEMGATWFGSKHIHLVSLLKELGLGWFPQRLGKTAIYEYMSTSPPQLVTLPDNDEPSFRIKGGTSELIKALNTCLSSDQLLLSTRVTAINDNGDHLVVQTDSGTIKAVRVVSTLPPNLFQSKIATSPGLPERLLELMQQTHTWMGESIKFALTFKEPFWRNAGTSGTVFSNTGPVTEMYDHADFNDEYFALKGFLNGAYHSVNKEERLKIILGQLEKYYGARVREYINFHEVVWAHEPFTYAPYEGHIFPHQHNGHEQFRQPFMEGRLYLAGSETAPDFPGYMDGAVASAQFVARQLRKEL